MEITLNSINKQFGDKKILDHITVTFPSGEIIGLIGPNGVGKTTLMRIMCHLDTQYTGDVYFGQQSNKDQAVFKNVTFMQDNSILYPQLTGYQHLAFVASIHKINPSRIDDVIRKIGMESYCHLKIASYSLGMKQHLLIALACLPDPACMILDEPYNGLDPSSTIRLKEWISEWAHQGKTILLSSHNLNLVSDLTDFVYFLKDANLSQFKLDESKRWAYYLSTNDDELFQEALRIYDLPYSLSNEKIKIIGDVSPYLELIAQRGLHLLDLKPIQISLEEIYRNLYV